MKKINDVLNSMAKKTLNWDKFWEGTSVDFDDKWSPSSNNSLGQGGDDYGDPGEYYEGGDDDGPSCSEIRSECRERADYSTGDLREAKRNRKKCLEDAADRCLTGQESVEGAIDGLCALSTSRCECEMAFKEDVCAKAQAYRECVENNGVNSYEGTVCPLDDYSGNDCNSDIECDRSDVVCNEDGDVPEAKQCREIERLVEKNCHRKKDEALLDSLGSCLRSGSWSHNSSPAGQGRGSSFSKSEIDDCAKCACFINFITALYSERLNTCLSWSKVCPNETCPESWFSESCRERPASCGLGFVNTRGASDKRYISMGKAACRKCPGAAIGPVAPNSRNPSTNPGRRPRKPREPNPGGTGRGRGR
jgi:hypothetical protein